MNNAIPAQSIPHYSHTAPVAAVMQPSRPARPPSSYLPRTRDLRYARQWHSAGFRFR